LIPINWLKVCLVDPVSLPGGANVFCVNVPCQVSGQFFSFKVLISSLSCAIITVLKVDMAMAAIEMLMAMKCFGHPGIEICDF
jgi:hypothetical protein